MQKINRRKFLQLCAVGAVTAARWLVTGGKKTEIEQEGGYTVPDEYKEILYGGMRKSKTLLAGKPVTVEFTQTPEDPDSWQSLSTAPVEFELQKSMHVSFNEDRTAWRLKSKQPPKHFVLLEPSEQMVKELEGLKAQSISILATYHD